MFLVADALDPAALGRTFETVIDSGLFHALSDADRPGFARSLAPVLPSGGTCFVLATSDLDSEGPRPLRVTQQEIQAPFESRVRPVVPSRAWLSSIARV